MARSLSENIERKALQLLMSFPLEKMLKPVVIDGCRLHPEMQLYLMIRKLMKKPAMGDLPPIQSRQAYVRDSLVHGIEIDWVKCEAVKPGHLYIGNDPDADVIIYFHGGGFVIGDNVMFDHVYRYMCAETGYRILAVDYRKAPEFPFPTGIEDGIEGYKWALENLPANKYFVAGDSAGANLAAVVTQMMAAESGRLPDKQLLFYPTCDWAESYPSADLFGSGFFLTKKDFEYFAGHYHGGKLDNLSDFRISPLRGKLKGLPSAIVVTAGFDPLRDQGDAYAAKLSEAGVPVVHLREEGMIHGFVNLVGFSQYARTVTSRALSYLKS